MTGQILAGTALAAALTYLGINWYKSRSGSTLPPKPQPGETIDISTVLGVQKGLAALGIDPGPLDGKHGPKTGAGVSKFMVSQSLPPQTMIDNALRAALAKALRAKGYTVTGESGATFTGGGAPGGSKKTTDVPLADDKEAQAEKLDDEADALDEKADDLPDTAIYEAAKKKLRDEAAYKRGQAEALYGEAKLLRAAAAAKAAASSATTKGWLPRRPWFAPRVTSTTQAGLTDPDVEMLNHCQGEGLEHGHRDAADGKPYDDARSYDNIANPKLRAACITMYKRGYMKAYGDAKREQQAAVTGGTPSMRKHPLAARRRAN